ncbi:MAG: cupredoxin domain-containing protein [Acidimicrobiales bacterium]
MAPSNTLLRPRPLRRFLSGVALSGVLVLAAGCGDDDTDTASEPEATTGEAGSSTATVEIERSRFAPEEVTVDAGGSVEFVNLDPFDHTVTAAEDSGIEFDSGAVGQDETFEQVFEEAGTYDYFCKIHPTMRATVTVE